MNVCEKKLKKSPQNTCDLGRKLVSMFFKINQIRNICSLFVLNKVSCSFLSAVFESEDFISHFLRW